MKLLMQHSLTKADTTIDEAIRILMDFTWLNNVQTPGMSQKAMNVVLGKNHSMAMDIEELKDPVPYEEYKTTKSSLVD